MSEEFFTVIFRGNIRKFKGSPFKAETVFGEVYGVSVGNLAEQYDAADQEAADEIETLRHALQLAKDHSELPDEILDIVDAALASDGKRGEQ